MPLVIDLNERSYYDRFEYPGGEIQVRFPDTPNGIGAIRNAKEITILARITNSTMIMELALLMDAIRVARNDEYFLANLVLPYLPYGRADRAFTVGDCRGLVTFADIINGIKWNKVITLDAHNPVVAEQAIENFVNVPAESFYIKAIQDWAIYQKVNKVCVLFPDDGARKRYQMPSNFGCNTCEITIDVKNCAKHRDPATGLFNGFEVPVNLENVPTIIVDDICDGGGTFLGIARKIADTYGQDRPLMALYTTHGIYSQGFDSLYLWFNTIYSTDSIKRVAGSIQTLPCLNFLIHEFNQ